MAVKRSVGDQHPSKPWVWTEYKPGKFDWRQVKNAGDVNHPASSSDKTAGSKTEKKTAGKPSADSITRAKASGGKLIKDTAKLQEWAGRTDEKNLVKMANSENANAMTRKIAFDELEKRGYDVSTINTKGTLDKLNNMSSDKKTGDEPKDHVEIDEIKITDSWYLNRSDKRVKSKFDLNTKVGRIKYDLFVDKKKREEQNYRTPDKVMKQLNRQYLAFLSNPEQRFMISAGGAGIGKSFGFNGLAEALNLRPYQEGDSPGDGDYDIFEASDIASKKQLLQVLKNHNGKIIVFDDTDSVLTRSDLASIMKKATSPNGKRIVGDPDDVKSNFEFTGRIVIMTNKDLSTLSENEDTKAIISRAMLKNETYLTVPETIEILDDRFQGMELNGVPRLPDDKEDEAERAEVLSVIKENVGNIDPNQFTTRTFQELMMNKRAIDDANDKSGNPVFAQFIGDEKEDWKEAVVATLTKAAEDDFNPETDSFEKADEAIGAELYLGADDNVEKAEDDLFGDSLEKAHYKDNEENRKRGRVGQEYGSTERMIVRNAIKSREVEKSCIELDINKAEELLFSDHYSIEKAEPTELEKAESVLGL